MIDANGATYEELVHRGSNGDWVPVPAWALTLCRLGTRLSRETERDGVVAVSLPFRDFAAAFIALGYVVERLQAGSFEDRFKPGDLVLTIHRSKEERSGHLAEFRGYLPPNPKTAAPGVTLLSSREIPECRQWRVGGVQLVRYSGRRALPKRHPVVIPLPSSNFRTALVGPDEDTWLSGRTLVGLVGHFPTLRDELEAAIFQCGGPGVEGALGDVLLLDANLRAASASNVDSVEELRERAPELVIFDGATSYGKWRHRFGSSHQAVVMDRSSSLWVDEISILKSTMATRKNASELGRLPPTTGTGLDLLGFRR